MSACSSLKYIYMIYYSHNALICWISNRFDACKVLFKISIKVEQGNRTYHVQYKLFISCQ